MNTSSERVVVTGGGGFIGSNLVDALLERGAQVLVVDDFSTGRRSNLDGARDSHANALHVVEADLCSEHAAKEIAQFRPAKIFHLGAQMNVRRSVEEPVFDCIVNVAGTVNILGAAQLAGAKCVVFASTGGAIYGEQDYFPADERHPTRSESPYGVSKLSAEHYLDYYARKGGLRTVALRFANVYGPRQNPKGEAGVVAIFAERLIAGKDLTIYGNGEQTRDFVYVGDVVDANLRAADGTAPGFHFYNVGTGREVSVNQLAEAAKNAWREMKREDKSAVVYGAALKGEQLRSVIAYTKLRDELGWEPKMPLEAGLVRTLESALRKKN